MRINLNANQKPAADFVPWSVADAKYSTVGTKVLLTPGIGGIRTRASRLAATFGQYSRRQGGYMLTDRGVQRFKKMYDAGWDGGILTDKACDRRPPQEGVDPGP